MLTTTTTFNAAISSPGREIYVKATIGAKVFDYANIVSFSVEESIAGGEELQLGVAACAALELEVNNQDGALDTVTFENSQINQEIGIKTTIGVEYVPLGIFNIDKSEKKSKTVLLKGFDNMIKAEVPFIDNLVYPATLAQIAQAACNQAGVTLKPSAFNNSTYQVAEKFYSEGATCRDVLAYVAGASGGFARCTRDGMIEIVWLSDTAANILPDNYITLSMKELKVGPVNRLIISKNDEAVTGDHYSIEDEESIAANGEYAVVVKDNPLLEGNMEGALSPIFNQIKGLTFHPYTMTWQGNPALQPLDKIKVTNEAGEVVNTLITSQKLTYAGGLKCEMKCVGKSITARTYTKEGPINRKVRFAEIRLNKVEGEILLKASKTDVEKINASINGISVGGRNILLQTTKEFKTANVKPSNYGAIQQYKPSTQEFTSNFVDIAEYGLSIGDEVTFSAFLEATSTTRIRVRVYTSSDGVNGITVAYGNYVTSGVSSCTFVINRQYIFFAISREVAPTETVQENYKMAKLERGNKVTDWTPAPEDFASKDELEGVNNDLSTRINTAETALNQTAELIALKADKTVTDELGNIIDSHSTQLSVLSEGFTVEVERINGDIDGVRGDIEGVKTYMNFTEDGMLLGKSDSPFQLSLSNEAIQFINNGGNIEEFVPDPNAVAWMTGGTMNIDKLEVLSSMIVGVHKIEKYNNDITFIRWIG